MILGYKRKWLVEMYLLMIPTVNLQMPVYPMAPPIYALPPPPPMQIPVPVPFPVPVEVRRPTTTTEKTEGMYFAVPAPYPVHVPVPMYAPPPMPPPPPANLCFKNPPRNKSCSQCPQCLRPPSPPPPPPVYPFVPFPVVRPPPVVVMPLPPLKFRRPEKPHCVSKCTQSESSISSDSDSSDSSWSSTDEFSYSVSSSFRKRRKLGYVKRQWKPKRKRRWKRQYRRNAESNQLVKPMLSYVNKGGDIKVNQRLSRDDAAELLREDELPQNVKIITERDSDRRERLKVVSNYEPNKPSSNHRRSQAVLRSGSSRRVLGKGKKEIVFNPLNNGKITNLSVSFNIE